MLDQMLDVLLPYVVAGVFSLLGVVLGAGLQLMSQHQAARMARKKELTDFRISKLEELSDLTQQLEEGLTSTYTVALGRLKFGAREFSATNPHTIEIPIARMETLVRFYFPNLQRSSKTSNEFG